ncbi:hypothetical protein MJO47_05270 [Desulfuromonas sp. KJ2020]|uniref:hypothetical protein n=1 Tax=Desulfuromonas sp. KJ2020 TaxID=2919173 RepID=UPI0020A823E5|nr:hypothetical protein [Desulfuromonas sp. KJ2020]MCP3176506.1 hypothetical protein [Desulfuromonas sp. KJ2020]
MCKVFFRVALSALFFLSIAAVQPAQVQASDLYTSSLNNLVLSGNTLLTSMSQITLTPFTMLSQLTALETSVNSYQDSVMTLYDTMANNTTTITLASESLIALQNLATLSASLTTQLLALSEAIALVAPVTSLSVLESSLMTMLRLSDDIGTMANRILEMADKILLMADNIGTMADRILATQIIQSDNLQMIVDASLTTQTNILTLFCLYLKC